MSQAIKLQIDAREFTKAMDEYAYLRKMDDQAVVADRAGKLAYEFYKKFKAVAPEISLLRSLPQKLNYRIKRKWKGTTVGQEISRRIKARFSSAVGWLPAIWRFTRRSTRLQRFKNPRGSFEIKLSEPSVTIINRMKEAWAAEKKYNLMQSAIDAQTADMRKYIERKLEERARQFSAK